MWRLYNHTNALLSAHNFGLLLRDNCHGASQRTTAAMTLYLGIVSRVSVYPRYHCPRAARIEGAGFCSDDFSHRSRPSAIAWVSAHLTARGLSPPPVDRQHPS